MSPDHGHWSRKKRFPAAGETITLMFVPSSLGTASTATRLVVFRSMFCCQREGGRPFSVEHLVKPLNLRVCRTGLLLTRSTWAEARACGSHRFCCCGKAEFLQGQ
jgi:hypothetical protein